MDTVSLLVFRHAPGAWRSILLVGLLAGIGLTLLVVAGLDVGDPPLQPDADRLLAPFRWRLIAADLA